MPNSIFDTGEQVFGADTGTGMEEYPTALYNTAPDPTDSPDQKEAATDVAMARMNIDENGLDGLEDNYDYALNSGNARGELAATANTIIAQDQQDVRNQAAEYIRNYAQSEVDIQDAIDAATSLNERITARMHSPVKGQREAVRGVSAPTYSPEDIDMGAVDRKIYEDLTTLSQDVDGWDYAWSFAREFFTFGAATGFDMAGLVGTSNVLDTQELLQGQAIALQAEPDPAKKLQLWEQLKASATEELPKAQALGFLHQMMAASGVAGFQEYNDSALLWSAIDSATAVGSIASAGLKSLPSVAKKMGNKNLAGRANARALEDVEEDVARRMGMSKKDAADNAHPIPPPERVRTRPDGEMEAAQESMSLETQAELQAHRGQLNQMVDNLITGKSRYIETGVHPDESARIRQITQTKVARYVESLRGDVQQANLKNNADGSITVTAAIVPKGSYGVPSSRELERAGRKLAELEADGFITRDQSQEFANAAKARGSSIESIDEGIEHLQEGGTVVEAVDMLDTQAAQTFTRTFRATLDETTGSYSQDRLPIGAWARSNRSVATTPDTVRDFEAAARLDNTSAGVARDLYNEYKSIINELPRGDGGIGVSRRKARLRIQKALVDGDEWVDPKLGEEVGRVWTPQELADQFNLSESEQRAYYKLRNLYDALWKIRNDAVRRELVSRGYFDITLRKPIRYVGENGENLELNLNEVGRPVETAGTARRTLDQAAIGQVFDSSLGDFVDISQDLTKRYSAGQRLVEFREPINIPDKGRVRFMLVDGVREIKDLPRTVLSYKTAYVPRVYDRGVWFVKQTAPYLRVDGRMVDSPTALRTMGMADNEEAARALQTTLTQKSLAQGADAHSYQIYQADQIDPLELALSGASGSGGRLYTSSRGSRPIPFYQLEGGRLVEEKASRMNPFDALQSNINNIAFHYPRTEWRIGATLRLQNTAKKLGVQWNGIQLEATGGTTQANAFINRKRNELASWLALPDSWETKWNNALQNLYEKALSIKIGSVRPGKIPAKGIWWLKSHDPVVALRSATFHLLLGWFNPVQLFVQAQGGAVAASQAFFRRGPAAFGRIWSRSFVLKNLENAVDEDTALKMAKTLAKNNLTDGESVEYMTELAKVWNRSGLKEGVLTTGDFKSATNAMGQGYGALADFANNKGLFFYREGELFARRLSLTEAFDEFIEANPKALARGLTDDEGKQIISRANDYMLNLGRANKAAWQRGVLAIPTQFWQVQAKLMEQYLHFGAGKVLNTKEKVALALGQIGLYGAAGVPVFGAVGSYYLDNPTQYDSDSIMNRAFDEGMYGLTFAILGADVEVAERGAILADLQGLVYDFIGGDKSLTELILGAGNTTMGRFSEAIKRVQPLALAAFNSEIPTTTEDWVLAADALADMSTTWSNASKAYLMWKTDTIWSRSGQKLSSDKYNLQTLVGTAVGFTPRQESQSYSLGTLVRMGETYRNDVKKSVKTYMLDMVRAHEVTGRPIGEQEARKFRNTVGWLTGAMSPDEAMQMVEEIQQEVMDGDTQFARSTREYMRVSSQMMLDEALSFFQKAVVGEQAIQEENIR